MKQALAAAVTLALVALVVAGCGKSADQLKLETDLSKEVTTLHDQAMAKIPQAKELVGKIGETLARHDAMVKKYPKQTTGHAAGDLKAAMEQLVKAQSWMDAWMKAHKPYDPEMPHEQALMTLKKDKEDLTKMKADLETAITAATSTVESHAKVADDLMAKMAKKKK